MNGQRTIDWDSFWLPRQSSTLAPEVDFGWAAAKWVSLFFFALVVGVLVVFVWKFRRRRGDQLPTSQIDHNTPLEILWTVVPLAIVIGLFVIGFRGFVNASVAPAESFEISVVAQKWAWSFTYPNGTTVPGELRVPVGRPVKLVMSSKDVLHALYIPEFRIKQDIVPGTYTTAWFEATRTGTTQLFCTQYCGTGHSDMTAQVVVMEQPAFQQWYESAGDEGKDLPPAVAGEKLFARYGCNSCHSTDGSARVGPSLKGVAMRVAKLADGKSVKADDAYLRESIETPAAKVISGFQPVMPAFKGMINDQQMAQLVAYLKSLK